MTFCLFLCLAFACGRGQATVAVSVSATSTAVDPETQAAWEASDRQYRASYFYAAYLAADLRGQHDEALILLKRAADADPQSIYILSELAEQYGMREQGEDAAAVLQKALALQPDDDELRQKLARFYIRDGKNDKARALFLNSDGTDPSNKESLKALAALDMAEDKWASAEKRLARLIELFPDAEDEREMYAEVLAHQGKKQEAVLQYQEMLLKEPGRAETAYRLASLYEDMSQSAEAVSTLKAALARDADKASDKALLEDALARTYYRLDKFDDAEMGFSKLLEENPQDTESLLFRAMSRLQGKKYKEAEDDFVKLGTMDSSNPSQLYGLGLAQLWQEKRVDAEATFKKLVSLHPNAVPGYSQLAFIYDRTSRTAEAAAILEKGLKENPESAELYLLLGSAQVDMGQEKKAEDTFIRGIKATGNSTAIRFQLAVLYDKAGDFTDAEKQLDAVIDIEPTNAEALNYLGYSWVDRDIKLKEAEELIRRAVAVEPDNHYYQDSLGWACYKLGQYVEAKEELEKAVAVPDPGPEEWIVFEHLAKVYERLGDDKDARSNFEKANQLKPKP